MCEMMHLQCKHRNGLPLSTVIDGKSMQFCRLCTGNTRFSNICAILKGPEAHLLRNSYGKLKSLQSPRVLPEAALCAVSMRLQNVKRIDEREARKVRVSTHTNKCTRTHSLFYMHKSMHTHTLSLSFFLSHALSRTFTHTHTHILTHTRARTRTHTHTQTYPHTRTRKKLSHTRTLRTMFHATQLQNDVQHDNSKLSARGTTIRAMFIR